MFKIITVFGIICSGKDTYMNHYPDTYLKINIGDIVRQITRTETRVQNADLDRLIIEQLCHRIQTALKERKLSGVVIAGIRQMSILNTIESIVEMTEDVEYVRIFLDVPLEVSEARYNRRASLKDINTPWRDALERDYKIGLLEVLEYLAFVNTNTIKNYQKHEHKTL